MTKKISLIWLAALVINPFGANIFELPKLFFISLFIFILLFTKNFSLKFHRYVWIFLGLWLSSLIISTIFSVAPLQSFFGSYDRFQGLYSHLIYIITFIFLLGSLNTESSRKNFLKTLLIISSIISVYAIFQRFGIDFFNQAITSEIGFGHRSFATLGQPNFLGQFLLFPIWIALYFAFTEKKKLLPVLAAVLLSLALLLTQNRASILGLALSVIIFLLFISNLKKSYKISISTILIILFFAGIFYLLPDTRSLLTRFYIWKSALALFPVHPVFGSGTETFGIVFQKVAAPELFSLEKSFQVADRAHNEYLDILIQQGVFGLTVYTAALVSIFRLKSKNKLLPFLFAALISILISNFFSFSLTIHWLILFAIIALILNLSLSLNKIKFNLKPLLVIILAVNLIYSASLITADTYFASGPKNFEKAAVINPFQSKIHTTIGQLNLILKDGDKATEYFQKAGKFSNYDFQYYYWMGQAAKTKGDSSSAQDYFSKASELAPTNPLIMEELR